MQGIRTMSHEIIGGQGVGTQESNVRKMGICRPWSDLERESWGEGSVGILVVGKEKVIRLEGVRGEEQTTGSDSNEMVGAFEESWSGVTTFGSAVADEEAGDVAFDEALVEIGEEMAETLVGPAVIA